MDGGHSAITVTTLISRPDSSFRFMCDSLYTLCCMSRQLHALQVFACAYNISQIPSQDNTDLSEDVNFEVQLAR